MNKQEALEALLRKARGWEAPHEEVRATSEQRVFEALERSYARYIDEVEAERDGKAELITIGAAALYLLTDEVTVVEGRSLDAWLASNEDRLAVVKRAGSALLAAGYTGPANRQPINGQMVKEKH